MRRAIPWVLSSLTLSTMPLGAMTVQPLGRQAIFLKPTVDAIEGNLMLRVSNPQESAVDDTVPLLLPLQIQSWEPLAGFRQDEVLPDKSGTGWLITQRFEPGMKTLAAGFRLNALFGKAHITIPIPYHLDQLSIFAKPGLLTFADYPSYCRWQPNSAFMGMNFDILACTAPTIGQDLSVAVFGASEGRLRYLLLGGIFGFLLFVSGFVIAWVGRPRLDGGL